MPNENNAYKADALVRKGVHVAANGNLADAIACLQEAVSCAPNHAFGHLHLALALAREGKNDEMSMHLNRALELQPENAAFRLYSGRTYFDMGDYQAAAREFEYGTKINPTNDLLTAYSVLNNWASGNPNASTRFVPENLPDSNAFLARLLMLIEADLKGILVDFSEAQIQVPLVDRLRIGYSLWRGALEHKRGKFAEASMRAEMALELQPGHPAATAFLRECRNAALIAAERHIEENPTSPELHVALASQLADAENYEQAELELSLAQQHADDQGAKEVISRPEISRLRGRIAYGLGRFDDALALQLSGAEPGFTMAETHYCIGLCHLAMGARRLCIQEFESLVAKVYWAVPTRLREYFAWRKVSPEPEIGT